MIFTGDFNAHSVHWCPNGDDNNEGIQRNILFSELGLTQIISEPIHICDQCQPTCIDLICCDQPNLVVNSGVYSSLDPTCKHQITFCKFSIKRYPIPPYKRKVWHNEKANLYLIFRAVTDFRWEFNLNKILDPNAQIEFLNKTFITSIFTSKINDPKWINRNVKNLLRKQKNLYEKYKTNKFKDEDKVKVDNIRSECFTAITVSEENYLKSVGSKLIYNNTGQKLIGKF